MSVSPREREAREMMKQIKYRGDYRNRSKQACNEREAKKPIAEKMWAEVMVEANQGGKTFPDLESDEEKNQRGTLKCRQRTKTGAEQEIVAKKEAALATKAPPREFFDALTIPLPQASTAIHSEFSEPFCLGQRRQPNEVFYNLKSDAVERNATLRYYTKPEKVTALVACGTLSKVGRSKLHRHLT